MFLWQRCFAKEAPWNIRFNFLNLTTKYARVPCVPLGNIFQHAKVTPLPLHFQTWNAFFGLLTPNRCLRKFAQRCGRLRAAGAAGDPRQLAGAAAGGAQPERALRGAPGQAGVGLADPWR